MINATIIIAGIAYIAGLLSGFMAGRLVDKRIVNHEASTIVLIVVSVIWATSVLIDMASPTYETSPLIHGLMGAIVGFFYKPGGSSASHSNKNGKNNK